VKSLHLDERPRNRWNQKVGRKGEKNALRPSPTRTWAVRREKKERNAPEQRGERKKTSKKPNPLKGTTQQYGKHPQMKKKKKKKRERDHRRIERVNLMKGIR